MADWINGSIRIVPFFAITLLSNYFYHINDQMAESKTAIDKFLAGDKDPMNQMWMLKIAARDLILGMGCAAVWQWMVITGPAA